MAGQKERLFLPWMRNWLTTTKTSLYLNLISSVYFVFEFEWMNGRKGGVSSDGSFAAKTSPLWEINSNIILDNLKWCYIRMWRCNKCRTNPDDQKMSAQIERAENEWEKGRWELWWELFSKATKTSPCNLNPPPPLWWPQIPAPRKLEMVQI